MRISCILRTLLFALCSCQLYLLLAQSDPRPFSDSNTFYIPENFAPLGDSVIHPHQYLEISHALYSYTDPQSQWKAEELISSTFQNHVAPEPAKLDSALLRGTVWYTIKLVGDSQTVQRYFLRMPQPFLHTRVYQVEKDSLHLIHDHDLNVPPDSLHPYSFRRFYWFTMPLEFEAGEEKKILIEGREALGTLSESYRKIELMPYAFFAEGVKDGMVLPLGNQMNIIEGLASMREMTPSMGRHFIHSRGELYHLVDPEGKLSIEDVIQHPWHSQFQAVNIHGFGRRFADMHTNWFRIRLKGTHQELQQYMLQYPNPYREIYVYEKLVDTIKLIDHTGIHPEDRIPNIRLYDEFKTTFVLHRQEERTLYFQCVQPIPQALGGMGWKSGSMHLYPLQQSLWEKQGLLNPVVLFTILLTLLGYHLILFIRLRERLYVLFVLLIGALLFFEFEPLLGHQLRSLLPSKFPWHAVKTILLNCAFVFFARGLLNLPQHLPGWNRIIVGWLVIHSTSLMLNNFGLLPGSVNNRGLLFLYINLSMLVIPILLSIVSFIRWRRGSRPAFWFFIAFSVPLLLIVLPAIADIVFQANLNYYQSQLFRFVLHVVLLGFLSIAFSERIKDIKRKELESKQSQLNTELQLQYEQQEAQRLKELDTAKARLYDNFTHEFRTPITIIQGETQEIKGNEGRKKIILRNSSQLLIMVNRMLDLSKLEAGAMEPEWIQDDIIAYLKYLVESFHSMAGYKDIRLNFYSPTDRLVMDFDPEKLQQIVSNLLRNAIKFTPQYGQIMVVAKAENAWLEIEVKDTGIGIAKEKLDRIFDRFYQIDDSSTRQAGGTGIGLALVKELIHLMEGEIQVQSEEQTGTSFKMQLPIHHRAPLQKAIAPALPHTPQKGVYPSLADNIETTDLPQVLIIEDNPDMIAYVSNCLKIDYQILTATNGKAGVESAFEWIPDLIICDVMMPELDGFGVVQQLKNDLRTAHIPIILLTAKAAHSDKITGLQYGADAYMLKPFDKEELLLQVRNQLQTRARLRAFLSVDEVLVAGNGSSSRSPKDQQFLDNFRQIILDNLDNEDMNIPGLCRLVGLSRSQLHKRITAITGASTSLFVMKVRMQEARKLLQATDQNVNEVAYSIGFKHPNHFSKAFKDFYGYSPSELKKG